MLSIPAVHADDIGNPLASSLQDDERDGGRA